ncbi:MAG: hypothetical protein FWF03_08840 [Defluviitaleaceae bacterium]|nr:hypothetical protein [Defluviitaleaceae bacterium]
MAGGFAFCVFCGIRIGHINKEARRAAFYGRGRRAFAFVGFVRALPGFCVPFFEFALTPPLQPRSSFLT